MLSSCVLVRSVKHPLDLCPHPHSETSQEDHQYHSNSHLKQRKEVAGK